MHSEEGPFVEVSQESEAEKQRRPKKPQQITSAEPPKLPRKKKQQSPQEALDEFWARVQTKHSGKGKQQIVTLIRAPINMISSQFQRFCRGTSIRRKLARMPREAQ
jgi:hypothetical protein